MPELFVCQGTGTGKPFKCTSVQLLKNGNKCPKCGLTVNPTTFVEATA